MPVSRAPGARSAPDPQPLSDPHFGFNADLPARAAARLDATGPSTRPRTYYSGPAAHAGKAGRRLPPDFDAFVREHGAAARVELRATVQRLIKVAGQLFPFAAAEAVAAGLQALPDGLEDPHQTLNDPLARVYLYGDGKRALERLADLVERETLPVEVRRDALESGAQSLGYCATRIVDELQRVCTALENSQGGVCATLLQARADAVQATLQEVVAEGPGLDPARPELNRFEVHLIGLLRQLLALPRSEAHGPAAALPDPFVDPTDLSPATVARAAHLLDKRVRPAALARTLAEAALAQIRAAVMQAGGDPDDPHSSRARPAFEAARADIQTRLGPLRTQSLLRLTDAGQVKLQVEPSLVALDVLHNLVREGAIEPSQPLCLLNCPSAGGAGGPGGGESSRQVWVAFGDVVYGRIGSDEASDRPVEPRDLDMVRLLGAERTHAQPAAQVRRWHAALATAALRTGELSQLEKLDASWLVDREVAEAFLLRLGPERVQAWVQERLRRRPSADGGLPAEVAQRLMKAATRQGALTLLSRMSAPGSDGAAREWRRLGGLTALSRARDADHALQMDHWISRLQIAWRELDDDERFAAAFLKDRAGRSAVLGACAQDREGQVRRFGRLALALKPEELTPAQIQDILLGRRPGEPGVAIAHAMNALGLHTLRAYTDLLIEAHDAGRLQASALAAMLKAFATKQAGGERLARLVASDQAALLEAWIRFLGQAADRGLADPGLLFNLLGGEGRRFEGALQRAMHAGAHAACRVVLDAVVRWLERGRLNRSQVHEWLVGSPHHARPLTLAIEAGEGLCRDRYLRTLRTLHEAQLMPAARLWELVAEGGEQSSPLGAALVGGDADAIAAVVGGARALHGRPARKPDQWLAFFAAMVRPPSASAGARASPAAGLTPAAHVLVERDQRQGLDQWLTLLRQAVQDRRLERPQAAALLKLRNPRQQSLLHAAAQVGALGCAKRLIVALHEGVKAGWLERDELQSLLAAEAPQGSALAVAIERGDAAMVHVLGLAIRRGRLEGHLKDEGVAVLLAGARGPRPQGLALLPATLPQEALVPTVAAYADLVARACHEGALTPQRARELLRVPGAAPSRSEAPGRRAVGQAFHQEGAAVRVPAAEARVPGAATAGDDGRRPSLESVAEGDLSATIAQAVRHQLTQLQRSGQLTPEEVQALLEPARDAATPRASRLPFRLPRFMRGAGPRPT